MLKITLTKFWKYLSLTWFNLPVKLKQMREKGKRPPTKKGGEGTCSFFFYSYEPGANPKQELPEIQITALHYLHFGQFLFWDLHAATAAKFQNSRRGF